MSNYDIELNAIIRELIKKEIETDVIGDFPKYQFGFLMGEFKSNSTLISRAIGIVKNKYDKAKITEWDIFDELSNKMDHYQKDRIKYIFQSTQNTGIILNVLSKTFKKEPDQIIACLESNDYEKFIRFLIDYQQGKSEIDYLNILYENHRIMSQDEFDKKLSEKYFYYNVFKHLYEKENERISNDFNLSEEDDFLLNYYSKLKHKTIDQREYSKYNLIKITDNFDFLPIDPPRLYDKLNDVTIYTSCISLNTALFLSSLLNKYDFVLSIKPNRTTFKKGRDTRVLLLEDLQRGKPFDFTDLGVPMISTFMDYTKNDVLWINKSQTDISFEEIIDDFDIYNDSIVTQVIHLTFFKNDGNYFIDHLDHEYIFYTLGEFTERNSNPNIKGSSQKRIKTFKINNAHIPFSKNEDFIIYDVLSLVFKNKTLIREYFETILN